MRRVQGVYICRVMFMLFCFSSLAQASDVFPTQETTKDEFSTAMQAGETNRDWLGTTPYEEMRLNASMIRPGMDRAQVEKLFTQRDSGPQKAIQTRYYHPSEYAIIVPYDQTGGEWSPKNRVAGPITLLHVSRQARSR